MRYQGRIYRPPSEANALILQATFGCSWNKCVYCDMYRDQTFGVRPLEESLEDLEGAASQAASHVEKLFVGDGDALCLSMDHWRAILSFARERFPRLRRVSCYAMARNVEEKSDKELQELAELGLGRLYIGPESGDDLTLKRIAKGDTFEGHVRAATRAHAAGMELSVIALLGIGAVALKEGEDPDERSETHARETARLITEMDPAYFSALTVTVVPGTPLHTLQKRGRFAAPDVDLTLRELRTMVQHARPTDTVFRTNHASNHLPLAGRLPIDSERITAVIDAALDGRIPLRPEWSRGL